MTLHCRRPSLCSLALEGECSCQVSSTCSNSCSLVYSICFILSVFSQLFFYNLYVELLLPVCDVVAAVKKLPAKD